MVTTQRPGLYILENEAGRGIFTASAIARNDLIELCPVIILSREDTQLIHRTRLHDYYFIWDLEAGSSAIALGYGSLYNHSDDPNAAFELDHQSGNIRITALKDIPAQDEIRINYITDPDAGYKLWFDQS